jgi:hypothetical protein
MACQTGPLGKTAAPESEALPAQFQHGGDGTDCQFSERPPEVAGSRVDSNQMLQRKSLGSPERSEAAIEAGLIKTNQHGQIPFS